MISNTKTKTSRIFSRLTDLPTLPVVVNKLLQLSEDASTREFADLIKTDQGLTAKVLKLVNSAFFSLKTSVSNVPHACTLIGTRTIRSLVLSVSVIQVFKRTCEGFDMVRFWRNALATGVVGRKIAARVSFSDDAVEDIYVAGLLHAAGIPLCVQFFPKDYSRVLKEAAAGKQTLLRLEEEIFGDAHPQVGGQIIEKWRLPADVGTCIRYHRTSPKKVPSSKLGENTVRLVDTIRLADSCTRRAGIWIFEADQMDPTEELWIPEWMGLDEASLEEAIGDIPSIVSELEGFLQAEVGSK